MKLSLILMLSIFCAVANAAGWECRNDMEVRCADGKCKSAKKDGFTPRA